MVIFRFLHFNVRMITFGSERIMFGTDYPMEDMIRSVEFVDKLPISIVDAEKVYYKNAEKYFGL